jgi:hypothetical protein
MSAHLRRLMILFLGALLVVAPLCTRAVMTRFYRPTYQPPAIGLDDLAVTPMPTPTAKPAPQNVATPDDELSQGLVWVDLAHFPWLNPSQFESLAAALAARGVGLRLWVSNVDLSQVDSFESFPDQSEELASPLQDASGLVVVSPYYLWTPDETALVVKFVADGGRLLLISDPDVLGDIPGNINNLGEPFGVVFNDDYLYDLSKNDGNYTHFFQGEFLDQAAALRGSTVAFYGARSIGGPVISQAYSADTTLSSLRSGLTRFTTAAIGGRETNGTAGNVLAMGDFDVLTEPYVARHDNYAMLEFVADFLANGQRVQTLPDFPDYLGKQVTLVFGGDVPVDAELMQQGGWLQQRLDETDRVLTLSGSTSLTPTAQVTETVTLTATSSVAAVTEGEPQDLIYVGTFQSADEETALLVNAGIRLVEDVETPEATGTPPAVTGESAMDTSETADTLLLEADSLRLLAAETILILQQEQADGSRVTAVLGQDSQAISAGLNRLLYHIFGDCVNYAEMSICPFFTAAGAGGGPPSAGTATPEPHTIQPEETPTPGPDEGEPSGAGVAILVVDDNDLAAPEEASEASIYLQALTEMDYKPDLWSTADSGSPGKSDLTGYNWVIWSGGLYEASGPESNELDVLWDFIGSGGRLTVSGRHHPLAGKSPKDASVIADMVKTGEVPALVVGFPDEPIDLPADLPPVVPIEIEADDYGPDVVLNVALRRGPNSADADAPLMVAFTGTGKPDPVPVRVLVVGMPLNWLPDGYARQLVQNMTSWILSE